MKALNTWQIKIQRKLVKFRLDEDNIFLALTIIIGILSGVLAIALKHSIYFLTGYFKTTQSPTTDSIIAGVVFIAVSAILTNKVAPNTSGSGIPHLKVALVVHHGRLTIKDTFYKFITSLLSLSSGMVLGREGPTVTITAGLGSFVGRMFSLSHAKVKSLVAVGAAGGIAAAFNTPMAAVTFTMEEILDNINGKTIGPIIIAAVTASITAKVLYSGESMFAILKYKFEDPWELPYYFAVGIICAVVGPIWTRFLLKYREKSKEIFKDYKLLAMLFPFFLLVLVGLYNPLVLGGGDHTINEALLSNITDWKLILFLFIGKFIFSALFLSSGISGGIFMPTLFMGAMLGSLVGIVANDLTGGALQVGAFALVGMGAYFATVIRAPFTSILIIFELTQDYKIVLPLMIANITAYILSQKITNGSVYEQISEQNGIHLPTKEDSEVMEQLTVEEAMVRDVITLNNDLKVKDALHQINHNEISGYPVLKNGLISGIVSANEIGQAYAQSKGDQHIGDICVKKLITVYADQSLMMAFHYLKKYRVGRLLVVSRINDKKLIGIITAENIVSTFGFHIQEESKYDLIDNYISEFNREKESTKK